MGNVVEPPHHGSLPQQQLPPAPVITRNRNDPQPHVPRPFDNGQRPNPFQVRPNPIAQGFPAPPRRTSNPRYNPHQMLPTAEMRKIGFSYRQAARVVGCSHSTVVRWKPFFDHHFRRRRQIERDARRADPLRWV